MSFLIYVASVAVALTSADAYKMKMSNLQLQPVSEWQKALEKKNENIFVFLADTFYEEFNREVASIANETLNVTVSQKLPYANIVSHFYEGHDHDVCGYIGDLWQELEDVLHFKTNFTLKNVIKDERETLKNSTDNLLLNPIIVKSGDHSEFDITMPIAITWYQLSALNPNSGSSFFYMSIFTVPLMTTYLATMVTLTLTLWFMVQINSSKNKKVHIIQNRKKLEINLKQADASDTSLMASFLTILGILTNQGIQSKPPTVSLRLLILVSTLLGFVVIQSYSAILLSQLAIKQVPAQVFLEDLPGAMPERSLCLSKHSIVYNHFLENDSTEVLPHWKPILNRPPCSVGQYDIVPLHDYCNEKTMVFESQHNTNYLRNTANLYGNNSADCKFYSFPWRYYNSYISLLTKKGFKYTNLISIYLLKFHTTGIIKKYQETWLPRNPVQVSKNKSNEPIKFAHMKDLLFLYLITALISLIILLIEIIIRNKLSSEEQVNRMPIKFITVKENV